MNFADFYALTSCDNTATVAPGSNISFPQDGPNSGTDISRVGADAFKLGPIGTYHVLFQVSATGSRQLILTLNGTELEYTVVGRKTGTSQIVGMALVKTTAANSVLTVRNSTGEHMDPITAPVMKGDCSVSSHLVILQIQ